MALPLYAITLFVSAFILFLVQPIVGKIILPKLGGTPQVWNTCMVFFQMVLLAGYAYTHNASTRLNLRQQLMAHAVLLILPLIVLLPFPFAFGGEMLADGTPNPNSLWGFVPDLGSNPIPSTLSVLFQFVALPFVVVATSAPLLQKWFVHTGHPAAKDPYFLYGASNFGSMLSLIVYPTLIEPNVSLKMQGFVYTFGYLALVICVVFCAGLVWNSKEKQHTPSPAPQPKPDAAPAATPDAVLAAETGIAAGAPASPAVTGVKAGQPKQPAKPGIAKPLPTHESHAPLGADDLTPGRRFRWVMLAAIPSSLMLGITTHITTDLSPIPLFWLIPLILYLLSFILVFAKWPVVWTEEPHKYVLYAQPFCVALMIIVDVFNLFHSTQAILFAIIAHVLGFFATTMMCHGEMAKDRPSTRHLTEFFLWMSVGGMVGGMFNALIAPVIFPKTWEFPLAIFAAVIIRPKMLDGGFLDPFFASLFEGQPEATARPGAKGGKPVPVSSGLVTPNENTTKNLDIAWAVGILVLTVILAMFFDSARGSSQQGKLIAYGLPLALACMHFSRPLRVGLGIGFVLLVNTVLTSLNDEASRYSSRSYFGTIAVKESRMAKDKEGKIVLSFHRLIHGHIDHGMNFLRPTDKKDYDQKDKDFSRLATTYYHREGPAGRVMEKFNWFPGAPNTYDADARLPASLIGSIAADIGSSMIPVTSLVTAWSEPPIATIGLGTGTMASYGRVYQHVHFYEIDDQIRRLSLLTPTRLCGSYADYVKAKESVPGRQQTYFSYLENALQRGSSVQVMMGDARLRMALPYKNHYQDTTERGGGPNNFYHMMVVDAFSSDAIPAHLLTKQAFQMYFDKLTEKGILCVHTSNRFVDLPKVVSALSADGVYVETVNDKGEKVKKVEKLAHLRGHDSNDQRENGHYTSEWVMVARNSDYLNTGWLNKGMFDLVSLQGDSKFLDDYAKGLQEANKRFEEYWTTIRSEERYVWTDDYYNILSVVRFR